MSKNSHSRLTRSDLTRSDYARNTKSTSRQSAPLYISQNFLTSSTTIKRIINLSSIDSSDHVIEIGPGKGHITRQLVERCGKLTAVELDRRLYQNLAEKYGSNQKLRLIPGDFLKWPLPGTSYKVFANIPFNHTSEIVRKLTEGCNPPDEMWLVMEKGAAKRFLGKPCDTLASLLLKPAFDTEIVYHFRREDFHPSPSVDTVLVHISQKTLPDIPFSQYGTYRRFLTFCFSGKGGIYRLLTRKQVVTALRLGGLSNDLQTQNMLYVQWLCLFRCYLTYGKALI